MPIPETYLWCSLGALAGWLAGVLMQTQGFAGRAEEVLVGAFGAVTGAQVWVLASAPASGGFSGSALSAALVSGVALLFVLRWFRLLLRAKPARRRRPH